MARTSIYTNTHTETAQNLIDRLTAVEPLQIEEIEAFQHRYGITNLMLAQLTRHLPSQISDWKNGNKEMPLYAQSHFRLLFAEFEARLGY